MPAQVARTLANSAGSAADAKADEIGRIVGAGSFDNDFDRIKPGRHSCVVYWYGFLDNASERVGSHQCRIARKGPDSRSKSSPVTDSSPPSRRARRRGTCSSAGLSCASRKSVVTTPSTRPTRATTISATRLAWPMPMAAAFSSFHQRARIYRTGRCFLRGPCGRIGSLSRVPDTRFRATVSSRRREGKFKRPLSQSNVML